MKQRFTRHIITLSLLCANLAFSQTWTDPINLGGGSTPDVDIDPATGNLYIVHHSNGLIYTQVDAKGKIIKQERVGIASVDADGGWQFGATIAFDPTTGRPHICYREPLADNFYNVYYSRKKADGSWSSPLKIVNRIERAYSVRMEVDGKGYTHIIHGTGAEDGLFGPATYLRLINDAIDRTIGNLGPYRADDRVEISVAGDNVIHIIISRPDDSSEGGHITYYRSTDGGASLERVGDIHDPNATGRNGNADIFADQAANVHMTYGSARDHALNGAHSLRYARFRGDDKVRDVVVTDEGEIRDWHHSLGVGSLASNNNGQYVVIAYNIGDGEQLRARISSDSGATWTAPVSLAGQSGGAESRDKHVVRGRGNTFYLVYPSFGKVYLRILQIPNAAPTAHAGEPYTGTEGSPIAFDASKSTDDGQIVRYKWDWTGDGIWDDSTASAKIQHAYDDDFSGKAILEVVDNEGMRSRTQAQVTVANVPPKAEAGGPYRGVVNKPVTLSGSATDPGVRDTLTYKWDLNNNGSFETVGKKVNVTFNTLGRKIVKLRVKDDDGGADIDSAVVEIASALPVVSKIPDQTVWEGKPFAPIQLDKYVSDPDHADEQITWRATGYTKYDVKIINRIATIAPPDSEWAGFEQITFVARDPANGADSVSAKFTVVVVNDPPRISGLADQKINLGEVFPPIDFARYIHDPDDPLAKLKLTATGHVNLAVKIDNLIVSVLPPNPQWTGSERITFTVSDTSNAKGSATVTFTVLNLPPRWKDRREYVFNEDDTLRISLSELRARVTDPDSPPERFEFSLAGNREIRWRRNSSDFLLYATPNWNGKETVQMVVHDGSGGRDSVATTITVRPVLDPMTSFNLLSPLGEFHSDRPDTIWFEWEPSSDPDNPASAISYVWILSRSAQLADTLRQKKLGNVTRYWLPIASGFDGGTYYWKVVAKSTSGATTPSQNYGAFTIPAVTAVDERNSGKIPQAYLLRPNFPNPFNPQTNIAFDLPRPAHVVVTIYDLDGKQVAALIDADLKAGSHQATWNAQGMASGIYFLEMRADDHGRLLFEARRKMSLVR